MQFAIGAMTSLFGGGTAATGAGTAAAAGAAGSSVGVGSVLTGILQGGLGLVSAMAAIRSGNTQAQAYRSEAADTRLNVTQEQIDATNRETSLRKQLIASLGERDTAYAASGVDLSFGTPQVARQQAIVDAANAVQKDSQTSTVRQSRYRARADNLDAMAADAEEAGKVKAGGALLGTALDIIKRG